MANQEKLGQANISKVVPVKIIIMQTQMTRPASPRGVVRIKELILSRSLLFTSLDRLNCIQREFVLGC